ncbi:MAG: PAS domain S-box protein [Smithella sp.]
MLNIIATRMGIVVERHWEKDALLESEIKFKSFAEQAIVGTYILQDGIFKYVNPRFAQMFGYTVEECLTNMSFETMVYPEDLANVKEEIRRRISGKSEFSHYTFRGLKRNGQIFHVEIYGSSSVHKGRSSAAGTLLDITERKEMETALRESDERFRALFDHSLDGVFIHDLEGNLLDLNQAVLDKIGYNRKDINFLNFASLLDEKDFSKAIKGIEKLLQTGIQKNPTEFKLKRKNGSYLYVETLSSVIYHDDKPYAVIGIARDLTDRKLAEEELLWKTALLEAQVEATIDGILIVDIQGKRILANQRLLDIWKVPQHIRDDVDDSQLLQYVTSITKYPEKFIEKVMYLYDHPDETSWDEIEFRDGMVLDRYSSPVLGKDGKYYGRIWTFRDITDRKRAEQERLHLGKLQGVLEMAGAICHEINQPMQIISGYSEMLLANASENHSIHAKLNTINEQIQRMGNITKKLMKIKNFNTQDYAGFGRIIDINNCSGNDNK